MTKRASALLMVAISASLAGCASYSGGHSGNCRYGLRNRGSGNHCYSRPKASDALVAEAASGQALGRALTSWSEARSSSTVASVGINRWAETTFTVGKRLVTFNANGLSTSGDEGYVSEPRDPFPVGAVRPGVLAGVVRRIRAGQPDTELLKAVFAVAPFHAGLVWRVAVVSPRAGSSLVYESAPDGSGLCHGRDLVDDALGPAAGIPTCERTVLSF
jgi:hypothetical protein